MTELVSRDTPAPTPVLLGVLYGRWGWMEQGLLGLPAARYAAGGPCCPQHHPVLASPSAPLCHLFHLSLHPWPTHT